MKTDIHEEYYSWMIGKIKNSLSNRYNNLLCKLDAIQFTCTRPLDDNRAMDGIDLRYRFGYEQDIPSRIIAYELDYRPCSVLEMMVALALRCEEFVMADNEKGDRTNVWFWEMIQSMGLIEYTDKHYSDGGVAKKVTHCLDREFDRNGHGWFFVIDHPYEDLVDVDIWTAAMWYLNTIE